MEGISHPPLSSALVKRVAVDDAVETVTADPRRSDAVRLHSGRIDSVVVDKTVDKFGIRRRDLVRLQIDVRGLVLGRTASKQAVLEDRPVQTVDRDRRGRDEHIFRDVVVEAAVVDDVVGRQNAGRKSILTVEYEALAIAAPE